MNFIYSSKSSKFEAEKIFSKQFFLSFANNSKNSSNTLTLQQARRQGFDWGAKNCRRGLRRYNGEVLEVAEKFWSNWEYYKNCCTMAGAYT